jgi:hypothetical protein
MQAMKKEHLPDWNELVEDPQLHQIIDIEHVRSYTDLAQMRFIWHNYQKLCQMGVSTLSLRSVVAYDEFCTAISRREYFGEWQLQFVAP